MKSSFILVLSTLTIILLLSCQVRTTTSSPENTSQITSPINTSTVSPSPETNNPVIIPTSVIQPSPSPLVIENVQAPIVVEPSMEIGAFWGQDVQISYVPLAPAITRDEATTIARQWLREGFGIPNPENFPVESTVALYSGPGEPIFPTSEVFSYVPVWIVVIRGYPGISYTGPPLAPGQPYPKIISQANIVIDATTSKIIFITAGGKEVSP